ncbi:hypothetical protein B0T21DRAFT_355795 [Apiosordaria backusii]|uniref:Uncharacterized protein n=1 Tax=Apiosordaria backusii TaxID=314023 RepID=A0AA40EZ92_9PEZI|nr:hypothetical protein B0T21DRAFT_355795 [Apiosordaria backusii]
MMFLVVFKVMVWDKSAPVPWWGLVSCFGGGVCIWYVVAYQGAVGGWVNVLLSLALSVLFGISFGIVIVRSWMDWCGTSRRGRSIRLGNFVLHVCFRVLEFGVFVPAQVFLLRGLIQNGVR